MYNIESLEEKWQLLKCAQMAKPTKSTDLSYNFQVCHIIDIRKGITESDQYRVYKFITFSYKLCRKYLNHSGNHKNTHFKDNDVCTVMFSMEIVFLLGYVNT